MLVKAKHYERAKRGKKTGRHKYDHITRKQAKKGHDAEDLFDEEAEYVGWKVLKNGWPDRLICDEKSGKVYLIEIKSGKGILKYNQKKMHKALKKLGIQILTLKINPLEDLAALELRKQLYDLMASHRKKRIVG